MPFPEISLYVFPEYSSSICLSVLSAYLSPICLSVHTYQDICGRSCTSRNPSFWLFSALEMCSSFDFEDVCILQD